MSEIMLEMMPEIYAGDDAGDDAGDAAAAMLLRRRRLCWDPSSSALYTRGPRFVSTDHDPSSSYLEELPSFCHTPQKDPPDIDLTYDDPESFNSC